MSVLSSGGLLFLTQSQATFPRFAAVAKFEQKSSTNLNIGIKVLINGQHGREQERDGAHDRAEAAAGDLCAHASWALSSPAQQQ